MVRRSKSIVGFMKARNRRISKELNQLATKKYVKKIIHKETETKYRDLSLAAQPYLVALGATTIVDLCDIPQGNTDISRVGDKITIRGLEMRFELTVADVTNALRIIVFQWYPNTSLPAAPTNPVGSSILADVTTYPWLSNYVHDYQNQYGVLYDKLFNLNTVNKPTIEFKIKPRMRYVKKTINFTGGTNDGSNKLFMLLVSDSGAGPNPSVRVQSRIRFDDA